MEAFRKRCEEEGLPAPNTALYEPIVRNLYAADIPIPPWDVGSRCQRLLDSGLKGTMTAEEAMQVRRSDPARILKEFQEPLINAFMHFVRAIPKFQNGLRTPAHDVLSMDLLDDVVDAFMTRPRSDRMLTHISNFGWNCASRGYTFGIHALRHNLLGSIASSANSLIAIYGGTARRSKAR